MATKILTPADTKYGAMARLKATRTLNQGSRQKPYKNIRLAKVGSSYVVIGDKR